MALLYYIVFGMLLYGPPGYDETLNAQQIVKALNSRKQKIVNRSK